MTGEEFLKLKGDGESPYGRVIWNYDKAGNEWLSELLEEYYETRINITECLKQESKY